MIHIIMYYHYRTEIYLDNILRIRVIYNLCIFIFGSLEINTLYYIETNRDLYHMDNIINKTNYIIVHHPCLKSSITVCPYLDGKK